MLHSEGPSSARVLSNKPATVPQDVELNSKKRHELRREFNEKQRARIQYEEEMAAQKRREEEEKEERERAAFRKETLV